MYYRGKLDPDVSEMPGFVMHSRDVSLIRGVAENEAEPVGVLAQPNALLRETEAVIAVGVPDGGDIYREPGDVL